MNKSISPVAAIIIIIVVAVIVLGGAYKMFLAPRPQMHIDPTKMQPPPHTYNPYANPGARPGGAPQAPPASNPK